MGPDGFKYTHSIGGSDFGGDGDSVELKRVTEGEEAQLLTKDKD